ncbi:MAG: glycoside hydrolase family 36 N-terminal domain-containing protein [Termitinemataceae bacterium]
MAILWKPESRELHLYNEQISYIITILPDGSPGLAWFGRRLSPDVCWTRLVRFEGRGLSTHTPGLPDEFCRDYAPQEYPTPGRGDFRFPALELETEETFPLLLNLRYRDHRISRGKPLLPELPVTYCEDDSEAETLILVLEDRNSQIQVELYYSIFTAYPVISRRAVIYNGGTVPLRVRRSYSAVVDLENSSWNLIHFSGAWARERHPICRPLAPGLQSIGSTRGTSSAQHNPSVLLASPETTETTGDVYGALLVYSGNFRIDVEVGSHGNTRLGIGINRHHYPRRPVRLPQNG